jgi:hypothetical protein
VSYLSFSGIFVSSFLRKLALLAIRPIAMSYQQGYGHPLQQQQHQYYPPSSTLLQPQQQLPAAQPHAGVGQHSPAQSDRGAFAGGNYNIAHRDTNAVLNINLQQGATVRSKSGAMIHMLGTVQLSGKVKFSIKKLFTGGEMSESTYVGPGRVALGPTLFGDIITLHVDGRQSWNIGKDAFLACTSEVSKKSESQGLGKAMFSGEDLFVFHVEGQGIMWLTSFGAVDRLDVRLPNAFSHSDCFSPHTANPSPIAPIWRAAYRRQRPSRGVELQL